MMKIAIIGAGNMGGAIARGLARSAKDVTIAVSNPTTGKLDKLKAEFPAIETTTDNVAAANDAAIIVIAVKPWLVGIALFIKNELNSYFFVPAICFSPA